MSDLRKMFTSKDFVINSNIIKCISGLNITLDEFLLILYFINVSDTLNTNDVKDKLGFDEKKASTTFGSLLDKKYIEINVTNKNGEIVEKISLEPLYDKLALNKQVESNDIDIYALFEKELGRTLSSYEYEMINKWLEDGVSDNIIKGALKEAILNGVKNFKYIDKIVYEWNKNGIKNKVREEKQKEEMFDGDWLDE